MMRTFLLAALAASAYAGNPFTADGRVRTICFPYADNGLEATMSAQRKLKEIPPEDDLTGKRCRYSFTSTMVFADDSPVEPEGPRYHNEFVTVLYRIDTDLADERMYQVQARDGSTFLAWQEELTPA